MTWIYEEDALDLYPGYTQVCVYPVVGGNAKTDNLKQTGKKLIIKQKDIFNTK